jgi:hypothetical protein
VARGPDRRVLATSPYGADYRCLVLEVGDQLLAVGLPQHPDEHRPEYPVLLAVDQQLGEGAAFRVAPELSDPVGPVEVRKTEDV